MRSHNAATAYDAIATEYDREVAGDEWMRHILWDHYARVFRAGDRVLDVGCGTGIDAVFLAQHGVHVTAIDISSAMIAETQARTAEHGLTDRIETAVLDIQDIGTLPAGTFDGIVSAFAALNTLPSLHGFADDAARLLRPGGRMILHLLNRFSLWEWLGLISHGEWDHARRLGAQRQRIFVIGGRPVRHYMTRSDEAYAVFAPHFRLCRAYGLGIFRPPHTMRRVPPSVGSALQDVDGVIGSRWPFIHWGRFVVLDLLRDSSVRGMTAVTSVMPDLL